MGYLDENEGLCSAGDGPNGCFMVFLSTLQTLNLPLPKSRTPAQDRAWWRAAYQRIAREGHVTLGVLALFAALVFTGCGPPLVVNCETPCGMLITGEALPQGCEAYRRTETEILRRIYPSLPNACRDLQGAIAVALPGGDSERVSEDPSDPRFGTMLRASGWTDCHRREISFHVAHDSVPFTAFPHEIIHLAQGCNAPLPVDPDRNLDHADWTRNGYGQALVEVREDPLGCAEPTKGGVP